LRFGTQEKSDAGQRLVVERDMERFKPRIERRRQDRDEALAQLRAITVARHEHETGIEPAERIGPHEQADARPLFQIADAERHREELVFIELEQLVAREALDDMDERASVVRA